LDDINERKYIIDEKRCFLWITMEANR
jgi:hypothetical protein